MIAYDDATLLAPAEELSALLNALTALRKGDATVKVDYAGWDAGFITHAKPDVAEFEAAAKGLAEEMVAKL